MDRAGFDPRYNPEFQRGFDPAVHTGPETSSQTHERIPSVDTPPVPRIPPVPVPAPGAQNRDAAASPVAAETEADDAVAPAADEHVSPWRNPYIIVLLIVGVVLLAAGVGAFRWSIEQVYAGQFGFGDDDAGARETWLAAQVAWGLSPLLAFAGVLTLIGVAFFIALTWRPYRRPTDEYGDLDDIDTVR